MHSPPTREAIHFSELLSYMRACRTKVRYVGWLHAMEIVRCSLNGLPKRLQIAGQGLHLQPFQQKSLTAWLVMLRQQQLDGNPRNFH